MTPDLTTIEPIVQRSTHDCAVAALAMYLGLPYVAVADAVPSLKKVMHNGMSIRQFLNVGKRLGIELVADEEFDIDEDDGVLYMRNEESGHVVLLWKGGAFNPADGHFWRGVDTLMEKNRYKPDTLIRLKGRRD
jgi:hypothetical protein